ncbi:hypothetical protein [Sphingopyxis sp.]|uniref:hypothetical protein n=1 Tax=Sphingopyxis sp. TaxID=1908224 RepID=UPI003D12614B
MKVGLEEFTTRLHEAMNQAAARYGVAKPSSDTIVELHLEGVRDRSIAEAAEKLFLGEDRFYKCIDVSVHPRRSPDIFFVRASGHEPGSWESSLNPETTGPFNIMTPA